MFKSGYQHWVTDSLSQSVSVGTLTHTQNSVTFALILCNIAEHLPTTGRLAVTAWKWSGHP